MLNFFFFFFFFFNKGNIKEILTLEICVWCWCMCVSFYILCRDWFYGLDVRVYITLIKKRVLRSAFAYDRVWLLSLCDCSWQEHTNLITGIIKKILCGHLVERLIFRDLSASGIAQWLKRWTRDWKVAGSNPCRSSRRIFFSRVDFLCWLLLWYLFHSCVTTVARKRSQPFCQKCRW